MKTIVFTLSGSLLLGIGICHSTAESNWPTWRGPSAAGTAEGKPPIEWDAKKNVKWKVAIPGRGMSTPIIWGDKVFVLTAVGTGPKKETPAGAQRGSGGGGRPSFGGGNRGSSSGGQRPSSGGFNREEFMKRFDTNKDGELSEKEREAMRAQFRRGGSGGRSSGGRGRGGRGGFSMSEAPTQAQKFTVVALDRKTGKALWEQSARQEFPHEGHHRDHGFASSSPVTDGKTLFVSFGSRGIYAYTLDGKKLWEKQLGKMRTRAGFGEGASPALTEKALIVLWDHEDQSFIVALDKKTGKELWRKNRDEQTSWTTPVIVKVNGQEQIIVSGAKATRSYAANNGEVIWEASGLTQNVIPTPVIGHGLAYVMSGFRGTALQAIKLTAKGDVTDGKDIAWSYDRSTPYVPSPVLSGNRLYFHKSNSAFLSCLDAKTGKPIYLDERLEGIRGIYASPLAANGHLYVVGREGTSLALKDSDKLEIVATNKIDEKMDASPVIVGDQLFLRGHQHLYCIAK